MHQLSNRWQKTLIIGGLISLFVFGSLSARHAW